MTGRMPPKKPGVPAPPAGSRAASARPAPPPTRFGPTALQAKLAPAPPRIAPPPTRFGAPTSGAALAVQMMNKRKQTGSQTPKSKASKTKKEPELQHFKVTMAPAVTIGTSKLGGQICHGGISLSAEVELLDTDVRSCEVGFIQAVTSYQGFGVYTDGQAGQHTVTYSYNVGLPLKDAHGPNSKFYDGNAKKSLSARTRKGTIKLYDAPSAGLCSAHLQFGALTPVSLHRTETFMVWIYVKAVNGYVVLKQYEWGIDATYQHHGGNFQAGAPLAFAEVVQTTDPGAVIAQSQAANQDQLLDERWT